MINDSAQIKQNARQETQEGRRHRRRKHLTTLHFAACPSCFMLSWSVLSVHSHLLSTNNQPTQFSVNLLCSRYSFTLEWTERWTFQLQHNFYRVFPNAMNVSLNFSTSRCESHIYALSQGLTNWAPWGAALASMSTLSDHMFSRE